jgi:hypothetical protein
MQTIKLRSKIGKDGILHLDIPVGVTETELEVTLMLEPGASPPQGKGYPPGFFEQTYGICADDPIIIDNEGIREDFDDLAAMIYGEIRASLAALGTPIGSNDLQIAAITLAHNLILVTHNTGEFKRVVGLTIEDWETEA